MKVVVNAFEEHPIKIVEGVLEASNVGESRRVVGRVLVDVHHPTPTTHETRVSGARGVAVGGRGLG